MATKKITKKAKKTVNKVDLKESFSKIKDSAFSLNNQLVETTGEVVEDLMSGREQLREMARTKVKGAINTISTAVTLDNIKKTAKQVNSYTLKTADGLVDAAVDNGAQWQDLGAKAVNGGLKLAAKQQDIMFATLETLKGQLSKSTVRFKKLIKN